MHSSCSNIVSAGFWKTKVKGKKCVVFIDAEERRETNRLVHAVIRKRTTQPWLWSALGCSPRRRFQVLVPRSSVYNFLPVRKNYTLCVFLFALFQFILRNLSTINAPPKDTFVESIIALALLSYLHDSFFSTEKRLRAPRTAYTSNRMATPFGPCVHNCIQKSEYATLRCVEKSLQLVSKFRGALDALA